MYSHVSTLHPFSFFTAIAQEVVKNRSPSFFLRSLLTDSQSLFLLLATDFLTLE
jgi:hypothetical protein